MTRVSRKEARILKERSQEMRRKGGGIPLAEVERRMRASMAEELHRMARGYDGTPKRAKALLDAILLAEQEGLPARLFEEIRREAFEALRARAA
jgi:hypothetical protein